MAFFFFFLSFSSLSLISYRTGEFRNSQGATSCKSCVAGQFQGDQNATVCHDCPTGYSASGNANVKCLPCEAGSFGSEKSKDCQLCSKGQYRQSKKDDEWTFTITMQDITASAGVAVTQTVSGVVVTGTLNTALTGANTKTMVVANTTGGSFITTTDVVIGTGGTAITIANSTITNAGKITPTDSTTCVVCPKGYYQEDEGQASCLPCIPGSFMNVTGALECFMCDENFKSKEPGSTECFACGTGKRSSEGSAVCNDCQPGEAGTPCSKCDPGMYRGEEDLPTSCLTCEIGQSSTTGSASCTLCDLGRYGSSPGVCTECIDKKEYQDTKGSTKCLSCRLGDKWISKKSQCSACDLGTYGSSPGECTDCKPGMYQDGKGLSKCIECPVDTYLSEEGKSSKADCIKCDFDKSTGLSEGNINDASCLCKRKVYYQDDQNECRPCPKGADCNRLGDGIKLEEIVAEPGYWRPSPNSVEFFDCSKGYKGISGETFALERCCPLNVTTNISSCATFEDPDEQCLTGYAGPLCRACQEKNFVMSKTGCKILFI